MKRIFKLHILVISLLFVNYIQAEVRLPAIFNNNMVLQQNQDIKIWGWAEPAESIIVEFGSHVTTISADANGNWNVTLPQLTAGGPHTMKISGAKNDIVLNNILIGEVWLCSGQSNMYWDMRAIDNNIEEIASANYPHIRLFKVPRKAASHPQVDVDAEWQVCDSTTVIPFSAVAYFFGRELYHELKVPIGLIQSAYGGTRIEPWTPRAGFEAIPELEDILKTIDEADKVYRTAIESSFVEIESWLAAARTAFSENQPIPDMPEPFTHPLDGKKKPTSLYNGQIHPLVPFRIRGVIWYQGESNRNDGPIYFNKLKAMITGWRAVWHSPDLPFYLVQLAPFRYEYWDDGDSYRLPAIRECQRMALTIPNTGLVVTTDIGNLQNIHPGNKQDVGKRLALWALARTYEREDLVYSGPLYRSMKIVDNKIHVQFDYAENGLRSSDGNPLNWFEIAGSDRKFVRARAEIKDNYIEVWSSEVDAPAAVRFGWHEKAMPNLINRAGLPASPFHSEFEATFINN